MHILRYVEGPMDTVAYNDVAPESAFWERQEIYKPPITRRFLSEHSDAIH